jgi:tetratricopeptide (TPR) repeat protein
MTLRAMSEMAWLQAKQSRWKEAIQTQYAVLYANTQTLGEHHPETMGARQRLAWMVAGSGDYSKSESLYKDLLEKMTSLYGRNHTLTLDVLSHLAWLYRKKGDLAIAVGMYRELLDARCTLLGYWNKSSMTTRMQLCELLTTLGFFADCKDIYDDLLRQTEVKFGESSRQTALVLKDIAFLYRNADVLAEGEKYLKRALAILEDFEELSPTRVFLMLDLAACYRREDRYLMAASQIEKAKRLGEGFLGPKHPAMLSARKEMAHLKLDMNDFDGAEETVKELLQQSDDTNEFFISNTFELKQILGQILLAQGKVEESEKLFTETIKPVMSGNILPAGLAKALLSFIEEFANIKQKLRHLREAEALLEMVLRIRMQNPMSTDLEMSTTLRSLCSIKKGLGKYSEAENLQIRVVDISKSVWGENSEQHLLAWRGLAACLNHPNALLKRYSILKHVAKKYIELYENEFPRWVPILREIGVTLKRLRRYEEAAYLQRAVLWWRHKNHEEFSEQYLWDVEFLAETYFDGNKYEQVKRMYDIASRGYRHLFGESHPGTIRCVKVLGTLAFRSGKMNESEEIFERLLPIIREKVPMEDSQYIQVLDGLALAKLNLRKLKEAKDLTLECLHIQMQYGGERSSCLEELFLRLALIDNMEFKEMVSHWEHESVVENFIDLLLSKLGDSKSAERLWFKGVVSVWSNFIFANDPAKSFKYWLKDSDIDTIIDNLSDSGSVERAWFSTWYIDDLKFIFNGVFGRRMEMAERTGDVCSNTNVEESESKSVATVDTSELPCLLQPILGQQPKDVDVVAMLEKLVPE